MHLETVIHYKGLSMLPRTIPLLLLLLSSLFLDACTHHSLQKQKPTTLDGLSVATFAGGCFWCMESNFENLPGVKEVISGYSGGDTPNPTYAQSKSGKTGHTETVQIYYDPTSIDYKRLLHWYWRSINPTDNMGQFVDRGAQYRPAIYVATEEERVQAMASRQELELTGQYSEPVNVEITAFKNFFIAEEYHQDYYLKHPAKYRFYRSGSGRDRYLADVWKTNFWKH